jgi:hypothetical protein
VLCRLYTEVLTEAELAELATLARALRAAFRAG